MWNTFVKHYNRFLLLFLHTGAITALIVTDELLLLLAIAIPLHILSKGIISTIYHKLWCHNIFKPKRWVNTFGLVVGWLNFFSTPKQYVVTHWQHHKYVNTPKDHLYPGHHWRFRYFPWIFGKANQQFPDVVKEGRELGGRFVKLNPWCKNINLEKRMAFITAVYLLIYAVSPFLFGAMLVCASMTMIGGYITNVTPHRFNRRKEAIVIDSPLRQTILFNTEMMHQQHHENASIDFGTGIARRYFDLIKFLLTDSSLPSNP